MTAFPPSSPDDLYRWFKARPGSDQIASAFALHGLAWWASRQMWRHRDDSSGILDIGTGIGTTAALLGWWTDAQIVAVEDDPWCQEQARQNIAWFKPYVLFYDKIPSYLAFWFAVLDGPQVRPGDWACLVPGAAVFIEGGRRGQRKQLLAELAAAGRCYCWAQWKPPRERSKGYTVVLCEPSRRERIWFVLVRVQEGWRDVLARLRGVAVGKRRAN